MMIFTLIPRKAIRHCDSAKLVFWSILLYYSADGISRSALIEYRNDGESDFRTTRRALSSVAIIFSETDLDFVQEMNRAAKQANIAFILNQ